MEQDKLELKDGTIWINQDIKKVLQALYDHYRAVINSNEYLREENKRLKNEQYKDEELDKMKKDYERMKDAYYRGFPISKEEDKKIKKWMDNIIADGPDMKINSARFHYEFYPTALGIVGTVIDNITKQKFEFQSLG